MRRNLVPDTWTADVEGVLPKLGPCPHDNSCVGCIEERRWQRPDSSLLNLMILLRYADPRLIYLVAA